MKKFIQIGDCKWINPDFIFKIQEGIIIEKEEDVPGLIPTMDDEIELNKYKRLLDREFPFIFTDADGKTTTEEKLKLSEITEIIDPELYKQRQETESEIAALEKKASGSKKIISETIPGYSIFMQTGEQIDVTEKYSSVVRDVILEMII